MHDKKNKPALLGALKLYKKFQYERFPLTDRQVKSRLKTFFSLFCFNDFYPQQ